MLCTDPIKVKVTGLKKVATTSGIGLVPCGQCLNCRVNQARIWTNRIILEACKWPDNTFLTLTYDEYNLPNPPIVSRPVVQKYLKKLRYHTDKKFKYFACAEYGPETLRPHYHFILHGLHAKLDHQAMQKSWCNDAGLLMCEPERLQSVELTPELARYCAGYVTKKAKDNRNRWVFNSQKEIYSRGLKEFALMSKGLGKDTIMKIKPKADKWQHEIKTIRTGGKKYPIGRYLKKIATPDKDWREEVIEFRAGQESAFRKRTKAPSKEAKVKENRRSL